MTAEIQSAIVLEISLVLMLFGLVFAVLVDPYMDKRRRVRSPASSRSTGL